MTYTDGSIAAPNFNPTSDEGLAPQGPVPAPCPQGGHSPARPSSSADLGESRSPSGDSLVAFTATYSPDDNKLRLYASTRLDRETYERVRAAGFIWAPRQELFVAPSWTPEREDLLLELAGEIDDEDTSLAERADNRAERFETYSEKRERDAEVARNAAMTIGQRFEAGQPILVGHHSERRARRDKERIDNAMQKAVTMWRTSEYWERRARGVISHAKYKDRPDVRARRIKTIEADQRRSQREKQNAERFLRLWSKLHDPRSLTKGGRDVSFQERAAHVAEADGAWDLAREIRAGETTPEAAQQQRIERLRDFIANRDRWIAHHDNRLTYERAILAESGWQPPPKPKTKADLPLLNIRGEVTYRSAYRRETITTTAHEMTRAEYAAIHKDYKGTVMAADGTHRLRTAVVGANMARGLGIVFLTDGKEHERPGVAAQQAAADEEQAALTAAADRVQARAVRTAAAREDMAEREEQARPYREMEAALKGGGVVAVSAPQLFPTPAPIAARMVELAGIQPDDRILEPSAGTGSLLRALPQSRGEVVAIEIHAGLAQALRGLADQVLCLDFLEVADRLAAKSFDVILMNPPFVNASDIAHIQAALRFLKPGGRLVAICADGPRQREQLRPLTETSGGCWEALPADTFKAQGTSVRTALLMLRG